MSDVFSVRHDGSCPYCSAKQFTPIADPNANPAMIKMQCSTCHQWSVKMKRNGRQYPLQDPSDFSSSPTVKTIVV
jgi:hypothetical protein